MKNATSRKKILLIASILLISTFASCVLATKDNQAIIKDAPISTIENIRICFSDVIQYEKLLGQGFDPLVTRERDIIVSASIEEQQWLDETGFFYEPFSIDDLTTSEKSSSGEKDVFHTYTSLTSELQTIAMTYSSIARLYSLGTSVQGRTIWGLKITDTPGVEENEPEVRICGAHHGNEYMSVEMPLMLAWHLVRNYTSDPQITELINNREIWIIPLVNPDGRQAGTRENAHGIDLNRNYGYNYGTSSPFSEPETQAMRTNALQNPYVLSLSFHCSGDIVNYIWNYKTQPVPDNAVVVELSEQYGSHNGYWVVEGYDWYQTKGDTNDFSYGCRGGLDWTIEVQSSNIAQCWNYNRDAMIEIVEAANRGLTGIVTDAITGKPLAAIIWIEEVFWPCFTDPQVGDYHKVLLPGTYVVHYQANGYQEEIVSVNVADSTQPTIQDVALYPAQNFYAYQVTSCSIYDPFSYPNNYQNNPTEVVYALGAPDGIYASLGKGGNAVVDMGPNAIIVDYPGGNDFKVYEGDTVADGYRVYVSQQFNGPWSSIGAVFYGTNEFDLAGTGLSSVQYVKIVDDNVGSASELNPGFDLDAVQKLTYTPGDLDYDGDVDLSDLAELLANYGLTSGATYEQGDLDGDGDVDISDLAALLANYGT